LNNILTLEEEDTEQSENEFAVTMSTFDILEFEHEFALQQVFYQYNNILSNNNILSATAISLCQKW